MQMKNYIKKQQSGDREQADGHKSAEANGEVGVKCEAGIVPGGAKRDNGEFKCKSE